MAEAVVATVTSPGGNRMVLTFDPDDVESFHSPSEIYPVPCPGPPTCRPDCNAAHRELGARYLTLKFKPGKAALWREAP